MHYKPEYTVYISLFIHAHSKILDGLIIKLPFLTKGQFSVSVHFACAEIKKISNFDNV